MCAQKLRSLLKLLGYFLSLVASAAVLSSCGAFWVDTSRDGASSSEGFAPLRIAAGGPHTCAVSSTGIARCWGQGFGGDGKLGYGNTNNVGNGLAPFPTIASAGDVPVGVAVKQIDANQFHTCAVLTNGRVRCWGHDNGEAKLGYSGLYNFIGDGTGPSISAAGDVPIGGDVVQVALGRDHTCALLTNGKVRCWGVGFQGQLGYGNQNFVGSGGGPTPTIISAGDVPIGEDAIQIAAGFRYTCALLTTGNVRCWGEGANGKLGYGNTNTVGNGLGPTPTIISAGDVPVGGSVKYISAGEEHTCAILTDGNMRCWGEGLFGKLGHGSTNNIGDGAGPTPTIASSGDVLVGGTVTQVASGSFHTCALLSDKKLRCWGRGSFGQLGYGSISHVADGGAPFPTIASAGDVSIGGSEVLQVTSGAGHTCVLMKGEKFKCWGDNAEGQLGYGNTTAIGDNELPSSVGDTPVF